MQTSTGSKTRLVGGSCLVVENKKGKGRKEREALRLAEGKGRRRRSFGAGLRRVRRGEANGVGHRSAGLRGRRSGS
jgi:hypothetical protein